MTNDKVTKIELTDKQIMRTELEAEKELTEDLAKTAEHWKKAYEGLRDRYERKDSENYHLRQILKSTL